MLCKVYFTDFLKTLYDFQMRQHESYLRAFTRIFRKVDTDQDGLLTEAEFMHLIQTELSPYLTLSQDDIVYFLQVLDPFNNQKISFSELV